MFHRFSTWWRALSVVLLSLATVTWPSAAQAVTTPSFSIVHQNALATLSAQGTTHFTTTLHLVNAGMKPQVAIAIFPKIATTDELDDVMAGNGVTTTPLSSTGSFTLSCVHNHNATFAVTVDAGEPQSTRPLCNESPRLRIACALAACNGVYPLRYSVDLSGVTEREWSLLSVHTQGTSSKLHVALIETLTSATLHSSTSSKQVLETIGHYGTTPITLSADYATLAAMADNPGVTTYWKNALTSAVKSTKHRIIDAPPGDIDFAGLVANDLTTQVEQQLTLSANLLKSLTGRYVDGSVLLSGRQTPASLLALSGAGVHNVVLSERDLTQMPSSTTTWGSPFTVTGVASVAAQSVDAPLSALTTNNAMEPGRRAAIALAALAYYNEEAPSSSPRTVVIESPIATSSSTFLSDFIEGMHDDAMSELTSLSPGFARSLIGTNNAPKERSLNTPSTVSNWTLHNVSSLLTLIGSVASYTQGVKSGNITNRLHVAVARAEITGGPSTRQNAINAATTLLNNQLGQFSIDSSSVTLAGSGTSLPITIISHSPYKVDAVVHLITDRLSFPKGNAIPLTLSSPTQSIRALTSAPRGSSLTLQVVLTTPNDQVVLARSAIQVRIAGTSFVGYVFTFLCLLVLGLWWWRTIRRKSKGRHAR